MRAVRECASRNSLVHCHTVLTQSIAPFEGEAPHA